MATTAPEAKIDAAKAEAAAEKAYAQAAAVVEAKAEPKNAVESATAKVGAPKVAAKIPLAPKAGVKKPAAMKEAAVKKPAAKPVVAKKIVKRAAVKSPAKVTPLIKLKDTIMTKTAATTEDYTAKIKDAVATAQDRAKAAFEKTSAYASEYGEFTKGNLEAVVESGKILTAGLQDMGKTYVAEGKSAVETLTADVKEIAGVKSPADFFKLQGEMLRRNFDAAVASGSKHSEAMVKLAGDAFAPISTRVSLAVEKVKQAA
jgi:phasin family protein